MALVITDYQINLGTPPTATDGDTNRTAHVKLNAFYTAAIPLLNANGISIAANTAAIAALGNSSTKNIGVTAGTVAAGDDARFSLPGFKNKIINGSFDIWQRGLGPFTVGGYTTDRWVVNGAGSSLSVSRFDVPPNALAYTKARYGMLYAITSVAGANNFCTFQQRIENVKLLSNKKVTVSFTAYSSIAGKKIGVDIEQSFGTGGSPSSNASGIGQSVTLGTSPTRYSLTFDVPDIATKTIGTNGNDFCELIFWMDAGSSFSTRSGSSGQQTANVAILDVQVEEGAFTTGYEARPAGYESALCERYYQRVSGIGISGVSLSTSSALIGAKLRTTMRSPPAVTLLKTTYTAGAFELTVGTTWCSASAATLAPASTISSVSGTLAGITTPVTSGQTVAFNTAADVIGLDSEL